MHAYFSFTGLIGWHRDLVISLSIFKMAVKSLRVLTWEKKGKITAYKSLR